MSTLKLVGRHPSIVNGTIDEVIAIVQGERIWCEELMASLTKDAVRAGWFRVHIQEG